MSNEGCSCCSPDEPGRKSESRDGRWVTERPVTDATLPEDMQKANEQFLGAQSVETLGGWVDELREQAGSGAITVDHLCHASEPTDHWGELDGERYYFQCFYDAVALAELADSPVDIHTKGPDGTVIEARADGEGGLEATPSDAVLSFGIAENAEPQSEDGPEIDEVYTAVCPYVRAFPDRDAYESWADTVPAETVGMPLLEGIDVATRLVQNE